QILDPLLKYVDNLLMQNLQLHDKPFLAEACPVCKCTSDFTHDHSTFLPLSPCGHWIHYNCFVWHCTRLDPSRSQCPVCSTGLYHWDGINALTLATRTSIEMEMGALCFPYYDQYLNLPIYNDRNEYEADCTVIEAEIQRAYATWVFQIIDPRDGSPNLIAVLHAALRFIRETGRPKSKWLSWDTCLGYLLFTTLVCIKLKRVMKETHFLVVDSHGWADLDQEMRALQARILAEIAG
ncbi:hypothetical protein BU24DRAFT_316530, partial [Aaosphaeria arxii CBS 175.79]